MGGGGGVRFGGQGGCEQRSFCENSKKKNDGGGWGGVRVGWGSGGPIRVGVGEVG